MCVYKNIYIYICIYTHTSLRVYTLLFAFTSFWFITYCTYTCLYSLIGPGLTVRLLQYVPVAYCNTQPTSVSGSRFWTPLFLLFS